MILSHTELEHIALAVTQDFAKYISNDSFETKRRIPRATPIDQFSRDYLGLNVGFARLSPDESVILSRLVDTFFSRISLTMPPAPKSHNTACVLPQEEPLHWQSRSSGYSSS